MFKTSLVTLALMVTASFTAFTRAEAKVGEAAPAFSLQDQNGKTVSLADYKGKVVVLEWFNDQCPFVQKHYKTGNMNNLAAKYAEKDVVWLAINSSHFTSNGDNAKVAKDWSINHPILNDASGATGKAYDAQTSPHMFVIDKEGKIAYKGAIDSIKDEDPESIPKATNYVAKAMDEVLAGTAVSQPETKPYGCSVKYK
jgi:peroxiredoxin